MKDIIGIIVLFLLLNSTCSMVNLSPHEYEPPQPTSTTEKPWIRLEEVSFNFDPRYNLYDAINIRMNDEEDVKVPEWKRDRDGAPYPAAYIKDREIMIKVKFRAHPSFNKFKIKIRADSTEGVLGNITSQFVSFSKGYSTEQTSIFRIKCRTPKAITTFPQEWDWHCEDVNLPNFNHHIGTSRNKIYILMDEPQHPWSETGNTEPWVEVLDISCNWAKGATTAEDVAGKITRCLYNKTNCFYLVGDNKSKLFKDKGWQLDMNMFTGQKSEYPLNLIRFLKTIPDRQTCVPKKIKYSVLCYDMAKALVSFSNVLGSQLTYRVSKKIGELNCIKPIGRAWTCKDSFGTHAFAGLGDIVFDACLIAGTPQGKYVNEAWMVNIPWNKYKEKIAQNASSPHDPKVYTVAISGVGIEEAEAILT
ncbi:MAG: hypothetical protein GY757_52730, partial [bacterium]|nr:hypothetical protein [bacterium]